MKKWVRWDNKYLSWGLTAFCVIAACILFYKVINFLPIVGALIKKIFNILSPFVAGLIITYLLAPLMRRLEKVMPKWLAVLICVFVLLTIIGALIYLIIPQLYSSIETIITNSPMYYSQIKSWVDSMLSDNPEIYAYVSKLLDEFNSNIQTVLKTKLLPSLGNVVSNVTQGVYYAIKALYNLVIGIIVSIYILGNLEGFLSGVRKILYSVFTIEAAEKIRSGMNYIDRTFMDFLTGKILDSAIIGLICYIACALLGMPYTLLISVIVGVTNVIPFFGPFIGAIPSALIILLVSPVKCLIFIVFIVVLQQIDGNIIGPKILGTSIGINGFWVMFSIILGAGLFGFWGMLLGVPVFVVIQTLIENSIKRKLKRSDLPQENTSYKKLDYIDPKTKEIIYK